MKQLINLNIFKDNLECPVCYNPIKLSIIALQFRCNHRYCDELGQIAKCHYKQNIAKNTIFENSKVDLQTWCRFFVYKIFLKPKQSFIVKHLKLTPRTVVEMNDIFRIICPINYEKNFKPLGGPNNIVEIDESRFGPGDSSVRAEQGFWVLGGVDRDTKNKFAVAVEDRTSEILLNQIKRFVKPGTTIYTDGWRSYGCLQREGFIHQSVNHTYNFVDPEDGTHSNDVERMWGTIKAYIPEGRRQKDKFNLYFAEYYLKQLGSEEEQLSAFVRALKLMRPGDLRRLPK